MDKTPKISLQIPQSHEDGRCFSLRLKKTIALEPPVFPPAKKILAVSDIEGNFQSFVKVLNKGGVVNKFLKWTFDDGHLVILGDCFDRGRDVIECLWLIYSLEEQARKAGGKVHFILGNHEIMNINGDWRYIHPRYAGIGVTNNSSPNALYGANTELWNWICTKNIIEKIGPVLFVHGGISPDVLALRMTIEEINDAARPWYKRISEAPPRSPVSLILNSDSSPLWYRGYYNGQHTESLIDETLSWFEADTIITGHTMVEKVSGFYNNKVINIDTDHANGISEGVLIKKEKYYRIGKLEHKDRIK